MEYSLFYIIYRTYSGSCAHHAYCRLVGQRNLNYDMKSTWSLIISINLHQHDSMKDVWCRANCAFKWPTYIQKNVRVIIHSDSMQYILEGLSCFFFALWKGKEMVF